MCEEFDGKAARAKRPMPVWVDAFVRDTLDLDAEQIGAYNLLLWAMWSRKEMELPDDMKRLAVICRVTPTRLKRHIWPELEGFFEVTDGKVWQKRLKKESIYVEGICEQQSRKKKGKKSANPRKTNEPTQSADDPQINHGLPADQTTDNPTQQPNNPTKNNNSEDKSSSLSFLPETDDDEGYSKFLKNHPKPRETARGEQAWQEAIANGATEGDLIAAAKAYAETSKNYDSDKIKFSDNWIVDGAWKSHIPSKSPEANATDMLKFWGGKIAEGGKVWGLSEKMAAKCVDAQLVTKEQAQVALAW